MEIEKMNDNERNKRNCDFFSTLPPQLQNQISLQNKMIAENKASAKTADPFNGRYSFTKWYS